MSQWTHVNASIRFDSFLDDRHLPNDEDIIKNLPEGSEGSLNYNIIRNSDDSYVAAMIVVIYGDLKDYDNTQEVLEYFKELTKDQIIRSGILEIEIENQLVLLFRYDNKIEQWI